jgi:hypothetical protein
VLMRGPIAVFTREVRASIRPRWRSAKRLVFRVRTEGTIDMMKSAAVLMGVVLGCSMLVQAQGAPPATTWARDWSAFVQELSVQVSKSANFVTNVNEAFSGKPVEWSGTVKEIKRPAKTGESGLIRLAMKPETLVMTGRPTLDSLNLTPSDEEWKSWAAVSVGDTVTFTTTLDEGTLVPKCVLAYLVGMGTNAGKFAAWVNTKGGAYVGRGRID